MSAKKRKALKPQKTNQTVANDETPDPQSEEQISLRLENVVDFAKFSYELEEKREQSVVHQSGQILTALSIVSATISMAIPILIEHTCISVHRILISAGIILVLLLTSMALAVMAQWRFKYDTMLTGEELLQRIEADAKNHACQSHYDFQWINQLEEIQNSKKKINDRRCHLICFSMATFFVAVLGLIVCLIIFII